MSIWQPLQKLGLGQAELPSGLPRFGFTRGDYPGGMVSSTIATMAVVV
jgi:hypothetical protein